MPVHCVHGNADWPSGEISADGGNVLFEALSDEWNKGQDISGRDLHWASLRAPVLAGKQ